MLKENFDNWQIGMIVFLIANNRPMKVEKFFMDDFSNRFCDRLKCSWHDNNSELQTGIFAYDEIEISGIHIPQ